MKYVKNSLSEFGLLIKANQGIKTIEQISKDCGIDRRALSILMHDTDIKKRIAKKMGFKIER